MSSPLEQRGTVRNPVPRTHHVNLQFPSQVHPPTSERDSAPLSPKQSLIHYLCFSNPPGPSSHHWVCTSPAPFLSSSKPSTHFSGPVLWGCPPSTFPHHNGLLCVQGVRMAVKLSRTLTFDRGAVEFQLVPLPAMTLGKFLNSFLGKLFQWFNQIIYVKCLALCLTHAMRSIILSFTPVFW